MISRRFLSLVVVAMLWTGFVYGDAFPETSKIQQLKSQKVLLNPMEAGGVLHRGAWHLGALSSDPAKVDSKVGAVALALQGTADIKGGKGDFALVDNPPGNITMLGVWVYLDKSSNVEKVGFQVYDAQGEALMATVPADWSGWKWLEIPVDSKNFSQAYPQKDKNSAPDTPLKSVHMVWFSAAPGVSTCVVDGLIAASNIPSGSMPAFTINATGKDWVDNGKPFSTDLLLTNYTDKPAKCNIEFSLQEDSKLYNKKAPDPVLGSDHALGAKSWLVVDGKRVDDGALTDGDENTAYEPAYRGGHYEELFQFVDLGRTRNIKKISFRSGDANWVHRLEILASEDGKTYKPVPSLEKLNLHKRWGKFSVGPKKPFNARYLKLHYRSREGKKENIIRTPASIMIYDGVADEKQELPEVGPVVDKGSHQVTVPANSFSLVSLVSSKPLNTGGYFAGVKAKYSGLTQLFYKNFFVMPVPPKNVTAESRFGVNASTPALSEYHNRMGLGWVRFENMKWAFISPEKDKYAFDGTVKPWVVPEDQYIEDYTQKYKLNYLPYVFITPRWASSAPAGHKNFRGFPPKDYNDYGKCIFQIVARYGSKKHPDSALLTNDKKSGLNRITAIELWNEPNLNAESWGPWVGPIEKYFDIFKIGAEAAKKADPSINVTSCGWAGISLDVIGKMSTYKYPNGKTPVDYTDILNVHYYSGRADPERAVIDRNVMRGAKPKPGSRTYEDDLRDLVSWWKTSKPGYHPIWLTETGYDVGGPIGRDERYQAAKLPRCTMMALASGIEKVFIYREKGSTPAQHAGAGFLRNDGSLRPSWFAFSTLVKQLHGVKTSRVLSLHIPGNNEIWGYLWDRNGEKVFSVWALDDKSVLPLTLGKCKVVDSFGSEKTVTVNGDLPLSIFPVYISSIEKIGPVMELVKAAETKERKRVAKEKRLAALTKYLFDFGTRDYVGVLKDCGPQRRFTTVLSADVYDDAKGFGFNVKAQGDQMAKWIGDPKDKDSVKVRNHEFRIKAKPGSYVLKISAQPFSSSGKVTVQGGAGGKMEIPVSKGKPLAVTEIKVGNEPLVFTFDNYMHLRWITLIEKE